MVLNRIPDVTRGHTASKCLSSPKKWNKTIKTKTKADVTAGAFRVSWRLPVPSDAWR
jgi:hypothetical protein